MKIVPIPTFNNELNIQNIYKKPDEVAYFKNTINNKMYIKCVLPLKSI